MAAENDRSNGNQTTSAMIDGLLRFVALGGLLTTAAIAPNALRLWDKSARKMFYKLDKRQQQREYRRLVNYMKKQGLFRPSAEEYEHGLQLSAKGLERARRAEIDSLSIPAPPRWDKHWRLILFDIPEEHKYQRDMLSRKLKELGCQLLQKSVWVHPYPCRAEIEAIALAFEVTKYVTYIEAEGIDASDKLAERFPALRR